MSCLSGALFHVTDLRCQHSLDLKEGPLELPWPSQAEIPTLIRYCLVTAYSSPDWQHILLAMPATRCKPKLISNVPRFVIDLSLSPRERYKGLAEAYRPQLRSLTSLFNGLLADLGIPVLCHQPINRLAGLLLRGVHSPVETAELQGIATSAGIPMYLLVSFNVVLDLLMGCTSGGVRTLERDQSRSQARMVHFRTLDWSMDPLRSVVVQLDFVRTQSAHPTQVLATTITYVGFVGVLTGVREGLSMSLNFRAVHKADTRAAQFRFYLHHLLVLLGRRASISSLLRSYLLPEATGAETPPKSLATISQELTPRHTTAAYLVFSDGVSTVVMEKDYNTAAIRQSSSFIAATNHDADEPECESGSSHAANQMGTNVAKRVEGLEELLDESRDRLECIANKWKATTRRTARQAKKDGSRSLGNVEDNAAVTAAEVVKWISAYPTTNESTHFATVLDPQHGQVIWTRVYAETE